MRNVILIFFLMLSVLSPCKAQDFNKVSIEKVIGITKLGIGYEVTGEIDLNGKTLEIPKESTLSFHGGRIINGTVIFDKTRLEGDVCIDCDIKGTLTNGEIIVSWFNLRPGVKTDQTKKLQAILDLYQSNVSDNSWEINLENPEPIIIIPAGQYYVRELKLRSYLTIRGAGRGSTVLRGVTFKATRQYNIAIEDISLIGYVGSTKNSTYDLNNPNHCSAFVLKDCARLIFKNVCVKNYDVAFDNFNTYLVDYYSCFVSYCRVCYNNCGDGNGLGGHAVRWFGGEMCSSVYGFVQENGNGVLLKGVTIENCRYGIYCINPTALTVSVCSFEANNYDIYGSITQVNIENNFFSKSGKIKGDGYIYAPVAIGYTIIQGNTFDQPVYDKPHIIVDDTTEVYSNILIGQNFIVNGGRIPVSDRLLPFVVEKGVNRYQTYLPNGNNMLMGQTVIYKDLQTGDYYLVTRDTEGELLFAPLKKK